MNFSQIILEKLGPIFQRNNLTIFDQRDDYLQLRSDSLAITFAHNPRENSNILFLSNNDGKTNSIEVDNALLKSFFNSDLTLSEVPVEAFVANLGLFFEHVGASILSGDINSFEELEKFDLERSHAYTFDLLRKQKSTK